MNEEAQEAKSESSDLSLQDLTKAVRQPAEASKLTALGNQLISPLIKEQNDRITALETQLNKDKQ